MNVLIIFGSTSGNTQMVAESIGEKIKKARHKVTIINVTDATVDQLTKFDVVLPGSSTWNDGELQDDFVGYHMELEKDKPNLNNIKFAVFGCGESVYEIFCGAVDILENTFAKLGGKRLVNGLKIDGYPDDDENVKLIDIWTDKIIKSLI